jgi:hypothetical protein
MYTNFRNFVAKLPLSATWKGPWGEKFVGVVIGLVHDQLSEGLSDALRLPLLHLPGATPDDALPFIGSETNIESYPGETLTAYRARLQDPWGLWGFAGDEAVIEGQFDAAGYPGADVQFDPTATGPNGEAAPYWSQFWVYFPYSSGHPVTAPGPTWGGFNWGDGTLYGVGATTQFYQLIHGIARKWKPGHWICRGFKFQLADTSIVEIAFGI